MPEIEYGSISSDHGHSTATSHGALSIMTQRVRTQWAGALSQYGSSVFGGHQSSAIMAPFHDECVRAH